MIEDYNYAYLGADLELDEEHTIRRGDDVCVELHGDSATITGYINREAHFSSLLPKQRFIEIPLRDLRPINSKSIRPQEDKDKSHSENWYVEQIRCICEEHNWETIIWGSCFETGINIEAFSVEEDGTYIHVAWEFERDEKSNKQPFKRFYEDLREIISQSN